MNNDQLAKKSIQVRLDVLTSAHKVGFGAVGSTMSVVEILVALYYAEIGGRKVVQIDAAKPGCADRDYVILSKGQAALAQYAILADLGFFDKSELDHYAQANALLSSRPTGKIPGIVGGCVSYGYGLSVACGLAMSLKADRKSNRVYVVVDDEELQKGQIWEAAQTAAHYNLDNLVLFVDKDKMQVDGAVKGVMDVDCVQAKFEAFGWKVMKVVDGHDFDQILQAVVKSYTISRRPICILCETVAGRGIGFAERKAGYHDVALSAGEMSEVIPKLSHLI